MNNETLQSSLHSYIEDEIEYALEETLQERNIEIVNNMLNEGLPIKQIARITQLDLNTVEQLKLGK